MQPCLLPQSPYPLQQIPTQQHGFASETFSRHNTLPKVFTTGVHAGEGLTRLLNWRTCILCYGQLAVLADHMNPGLCVSSVQRAVTEESEHSCLCTMVCTSAGVLTLSVSPPFFSYAPFYFVVYV
jgi:hypothetical protein